MPRKVRVNAKQQAALLVAEDQLTDVEIAETCGVSDRQLRNWKASESFRALVEGHLSEYRERIRGKGIAVLERRVEALNDRWKLLEQVRRERAADASMQTVPGGSTGLLIRRGKLVKVFTPLQVASASQMEDDPCPQCSEGMGDDDDAPRLRSVLIIQERTGEEKEHLLCPVCGDRWRDTDQLASAKLSEIVYEYELDTGLLKEMRDHERQTAQELGQWKDRQDVTIHDDGAAETLDRKLAGLAARLGPQDVPGEPDAGGADGAPDALDLLGAG